MLETIAEISAAGPILAARQQSAVLDEAQISESFSATPVHRRGAYLCRANNRSLLHDPLTVLGERRRSSHNANQNNELYSVVQRYAAPHPSSGGGTRTPDTRIMIQHGYIDNGNQDNDLREIEKPRAAPGAAVVTANPDLAAVLSAWPNLPDPIKAGILAMVKAAS